MGNHNFFDSSCVYSFQKGNKTFAFSVESWADIADNFVFWVVLSEDCNLSFKVILLMFWANSGITDLILLRKLCLVISKDFTYVRGWVESFSTGCPDNRNSFRFCPSLQCFSWDVIRLFDFACTLVSNFVLIQDVKMWFLFGNVRLPEELCFLKLFFLVFDLKCGGSLQNRINNW